MGIVVVEICDINVMAGLPLQDLETEYPGVSVLFTSCLGHCEHCADFPYAYVNGEMLSDENPERLLAKLKERIKAGLTL